MDIVLVGLAIVPATIGKTPLFPGEAKLTHCSLNME